MKFSPFSLNRHCIAGLVLAAAASQVAHAVTLDELLAKADEHPSVKRATTDRDVAGFDLDAAHWRRYPSLSINAASKDSSPNASTITLEQPVWSGGSITSGIEAAEFGLASSKDNVEFARETAFRDIGRNYIELLRYTDKSVAAIESIDVLDKLRETMRLRVEQKISPRSEFITVDSRLHQARSLSFQIEGAKQKAIEALYEATNVQVVNPVNLDCEIPANYSAKSLLSDALESSPNLKKLANDKNRFLSEITQSKADWLPKLVVGVENTRDNGFSGDDDTTAYLALRYQLTDGLSSVSRTSAARSRAASATYQYEMTERELRQEVRTLVESYAASSNQIEPLKQLVSSNSQLIESYLQQYKVGKKSWLDVVNIQREYVQAKMALTDAQSDICASAFDLQTLVGASFVKNSQ